MMTPEKLLEQLAEKDPFNYGLMPPPIEAQEGLTILINHFLGENWYSMNPISQEQVNTEAICQILEQFPNKKKWWFKR